MWGDFFKENNYVQVSLKQLVIISKKKIWKHQQNKCVQKYTFNNNDQKNLQEMYTLQI